MSQSTQDWLAGMAANVLIVIVGVCLAAVMLAGTWALVRAIL